MATPDLRSLPVQCQHERDQPEFAAAQIRTPQADGIRGLAILQIVVWHYFAGASQLLLLSWSGVDLFFILSGFLIGGILLDNNKSTNYYRVFYVRRFFRIIPLYFLILLIGGCLHYIHRTGAGIGWLWYIFLIQNLWIAVHASWSIWLPQSWSLAVEEQFYFTVPFIIRVVPRQKLPLLILGLISMSIIVRVAIDIADTRPDGAAFMNYVLLPCRMDSLLLGVLCAWALRVPKVRQWLLANVLLLYVLLGALFTVVLLMIVQRWGWDSQFTRTVGLTVLALFYAVFLLVALLEERGPIRYFSSLRPLQLLGLWSYSIYLLHILLPESLSTVIPTMTSFGHRAVLYLSLLLLLVVADLSFRYFERPLVAIGHRWKYRNYVPAAATAPVRELGRS